MKTQTGVAQEREQDFLPIISNPHLLSRGQRLVGGALTLAFWSIWLYILTPLLSLLTWIFGLSLFYEEFVARDGAAEILDMLPFLLFSATLPSAALLIWARYNYLRFRGIQRRARRSDVSLEELAIYCGLEEEMILLLQNSPLLTVEHDGQGKLLEVHPGPLIFADNQPRSKSSPLPSQTSANAMRKARK